MKLNLTDEQVSMIIDALDYVAHNEAGQTQEPDLCKAEDFEHYALARDIERRATRAEKLRAQWATHPQTGESVRITP
jgi:hypothetical protein